MTFNKSDRQAVPTRAQSIFFGLKHTCTLGVILYVFGAAIQYDFEETLLSQYLFAYTAVIMFASVSWLMDRIMEIWEVLSDKLIEQFRRWPKVRYTFLLFFTVLAFAAGPFFLVLFSEAEVALKVLIFILLVLVLPSALISIVKEDVRRQRTYLARHQITPELIAQNPQAAIENAFTHFEDRLRQRLCVGPEIYGDALINLAFNPQNGRLRYGAVVGEQQGLRNFVAGAYATFRNPRKHRIINDDQQNAQAIVSLVELLIRLVDEAEECPPSFQT